MERQSQGRTSLFLILIIGIVIGLLVAGGFFLIGSRSSETKKPSSETKGLLLSINTPSDGEVVNSKDLTIKGSTGKDSIVAITSEKQDHILETSGGNFSTNVELAEGENQLTVYAFDVVSGESIQTSLNILYLTGEISQNFLLVAEANSEAAANEEKIDKLREKLSTKSAEIKKQNALLKRSHIVGTIISIAGATLTIEANNGNEKTVFADDLTKFVSIGDGKKLINLADLKVGDRVAVTGIDSEGTFGTAKVVARLEKEPPKRHAIVGKVKEIKGDLITLTHLIHTDRVFSVKVNNDTFFKTKNNKDLKAEDVKIDEIVVVSGSIEKDGTIVAKRVFIIKEVSIKPKDATSSATPSAQ